MTILIPHWEDMPLLRRTLHLAARAGLVLSFAAALCPTGGVSQQLPPRLALSPPSPGPCEPLHDGSSTPLNPAQDARAEARRLLEEANQAAILGNEGQARTLLRRAADLDPTSEEIAYRLGRILEDAGEPDAALAEFCRHLRIAPDGPDAREVEERVAVLGGTRSGAIPASARSAFGLGIEALDRDDPSQAALHFSRALVEHPDWPEAHYNRAIAYLQGGREAAGWADLERYLELEPEGPRAEAAARLTRTVNGAAAPSPRTALMTGLVVPGMGHMVSGRPRAGALVLGGAGAAAAAGLLYTRVDVSCRVPPVEGACPPSQVAERVEARPFLTAGLATAAVITVLGAVHASRSARARSTTVSLGERPALRVALDALSGDPWDVTVEIEPTGGLGRRGGPGVAAALRIRF